MGVKVELCTATTGVSRTDEYPDSKEWFFDVDGSFKIYASEDTDESYAAEYPKDNVLRVYMYETDSTEPGDTQEPDRV